MRLKSLRLRNVRSHEDSLVEFPEGSVLLSGDVGSGKSSILLGVEFALFGDLRIVPGSALLRHGAESGFAELTFTLDGMEVVIHRSLKRSKNSVKQGPGFLLINGSRFEGTAVELKAKVLELLGYPSELLSKSKELIYRYTVYTPQEEMKSILFENADARLETLRKLFNVDKYKRVLENAALLAKELRSNAKLLEGKAEELILVRKELEEKEEALRQAARRAAELRGLVAEARKELRKAEEEVKRFQEGEKELSSLKSELRRVEALKREKQELLERNSSELEKLLLEAEALEGVVKGLEGLTPEQAAKEVAEKEEALKSVEEKLRVLDQRVALLTEKVRSAREEKERIKSLKKCPTCKQEVTREHAERIAAERDKEIREWGSKLERYGKLREALTAKVEALREALKKSRLRERKAFEAELKRKRLREVKEREASLRVEKERLAKELKKLNAERDALEQRAREEEQALQSFQRAREEEQALREKHRTLELELANAERDSHHLSNAAKELKDRLKVLKGYRESASKLREAEHWLENYFSKTVSLIERQVMLKIHRDFKDCFTSWFNSLMEDESLTVTLDDSFNPVVVQDGYESSVENLSGGEKTSVALAYRLALNKVINDFVTTIKTRDLIILDEPTDGFSEEQLDRVRLVLAELGTRQTIIVSHEQKIEGFVDHVVRVEKEGNASTVRLAS